MARRIGLVVGVKPEKLDYYKEIHADCWAGVLDRTYLRGAVLAVSAAAALIVVTVNLL